MNPIEYQQSIVYCDNPQCGYKEEVKDRSLLKSYINKPCPKCGQVMFSQEDFDRSEELMKLIKILNPLLPQESISEDIPPKTLKIGFDFQNGEYKGIEIKDDGVKSVEKEKRNPIKPIPNSQIFESKKNLDEIQRKVNFYLEVQKIEPQLPVDQKIEWLIDALDILSIK